MAAYGMIILQLARKHIGTGWLVYDRQFRQHQAAGANLPWSDLSPSLMVATVLSQASGCQGRSCSLCLAADHLREDCALAALEPSSSSGQHSRTYYSGRQSRRPAPYGTTDNICRRFNRGYCGSSPCRYDHVCSGCYKPGHPESQCLEGKAKFKTCPSDAKAGGPSQKHLPLWARLSEAPSVLLNIITHLHCLEQPACIHSVRC